MVKNVVLVALIGWGYERAYATLQLVAGSGRHMVKSVEYNLLMSYLDELQSLKAIARVRRRSDDPA